MINLVPGAKRLQVLKGMVISMIRLILVAVFLILFLVLSIPLLLAEWIIGKFNQDVKDKSSLAIVLWAFRCIMFLTGAEVIVKGLEKVPKDTAVLYVGNHRSYFDVVMTYIRVPRPTGYISKIEMKRYPLLSNWMTNLHCLFLDRNDVKQGMKTILSAIDKVKHGISICVFPEGTRNRVNDTFLPFKEGSFKVATKGKVPIVPISIVNSAAIFEDHMPWIKKATVVIEYCDPIYVDQLDKEIQKTLGAYTSHVIEETYFKNKEEYFKESK